MSQFGMTEALASWYPLEDANSRATVFPFKTGAPAKSYVASAFSQPIGSWDDPIAPSEEGLPYHCYCAYVTMADDHKPVSIYAYLNLVAGSGAGKVAAAVYDLAGNLVVGSAALVFSTGTGWVEFPLTGAPALSDGTSYGIWVRGDYDAVNDVAQLAYGVIADYVPPPNPPNGGGPVAVTVTDAVGVAEPVAVKQHGLTLTDAVGANEPDRATLIAPCWGRYINLRDMLGI